MVAPRALVVPSMVNKSRAGPASGRRVSSEDNIIQRASSRRRRYVVSMGCSETQREIVEGATR
jgi:hypothetical protein